MMRAGGDNGCVTAIPREFDVAQAQASGAAADARGGEVRMSTHSIRPETAVLTRGFDPRLSVGSARPPVYRSSTYVFPSPEAAERAFAIALGRSRPSDGENVDLIYSRLSHPNAE